MRLLLDQNLSFRIARQLQQAGHDAVHVDDVGLDDTDDPLILTWAERHQRTVVTADADFSEMLALAGASAPSIVHLRSADQQAHLLLQALEQTSSELNAGAVASGRLTPPRPRPHQPLADQTTRGPRVAADRHRDRTGTSSHVGTSRVGTAHRPLDTCGEVSTRS